MRREADKSYRIRIRSGEENLVELIDDLARQVVRKHMDDFQADNRQVKKITAAGRAA